VETITQQPHKSFLFSDPTHVGEARRFAHGLAKRLGFPEEAIGKIEIIVNELGTNLLKHGGSEGELLIAGTQLEDNAGTVEVIALDKGEGIKNIPLMMEDGVTTTSSLGSGLGALKRLADSFEIASVPGRGTIVVTRKVSAPKARGEDKNEQLDIHGICVPMSGQEVCGDGWTFLKDRSVTQLLVIDGLGHGFSARKAAELAINRFLEAKSPDPHMIFSNLNAALLGSTGAAIALAIIDSEENKMTFTGIGNINTRIVRKDGGTQGCASMPGIVGYRAQHVRTFDFNLFPGDIVVLASDGIKSQFELQDVASRDLSVLAASLYRDYKRGSDDRTVVVVGFKRGGS
jgi:anti-sigma regulatory factor (Ser/Thr protein kinase)